MDDTGTILLVGDNPNDVEITCATLGENRPILEISASNDGKEALDYLCCPGAHRSRPAAKPAMVLLYLELPKVDGLEVPQCSETDPNIKTIVVTMPTCSCEESDLLRSCDLGMDAYVVRPMSYEGFIEAIRKVGPFWGTLNQLPSTTVHDQ
jgi:CheY-like chemotaxis protein